MVLVQKQGAQFAQLLKFLCSSGEKLGIEMLWQPQKVIDFSN